MGGICALASRPNGCALGESRQRCNCKSSTYAKLDRGDVNNEVSRALNLSSPAGGKGLQGMEEVEIRQQKGFCARAFFAIYSWSNSIETATRQVWHLVLVSAGQVQALWSTKLQACQVACSNTGQHCEVIQEAGLTTPCTAFLKLYLL